MRIIARRTLRAFIGTLVGHRDQSAVKAALDAWFDEVRKARWQSTADLRRAYATITIASM
jgi:mRNA interferase HigB